MDYNYLPKTPSGICRPRNGKYYISDDPYIRNRYYAFLKHRSFRQARNEPYELTWEDFDAVWTAELWARRGRGVDKKKGEAGRG